MTPRSLLALIATFAPLQCWAAVQDTRPGAFRVQSVVLVELAPADAYRALVRVREWWDPAHTWSGAARNLSLKGRAGGCFCEALENGGTVEHGRVVMAQPGKLLRIDGALGPLQEMAVTGVLSYEFAPDGPGTRITMSYRAAGDLTMDATKLAPLVDQVLTGQLERFRDHANAVARRR